MKRSSVFGYLLGGAVAACATFANPGDAAAGLESFNGYVCRVYVYGTDVPNVPNVSFYSEPGCAGTYIGTSYGLNSANGSTYPEQIDRLYQAALASATTDARVSVTWNVLNIFGSTIRMLQTITVNAN